MQKELQDLLAIHLGELLYQYEHNFDWIEKSGIARKINSVYALLDIDKRLDAGIINIIGEVMIEGKKFWKCHLK